MTNPGDKTYDVCIIGSGLAGLTATLFAANRGLTCIEVGQIGEIHFASGLLDLLGVYPVENNQVWSDPWEGIKFLVQDNSQHPYARLALDDIRTAFEEILTFLKENDLPYNRRINRNSSVLTALGSRKSTYCVPHSMWNSVEALDKKPPCVLIDIRGLKGFSARQIASVLKSEWPNLQTARISFPNTDHLNEVYAEQMAGSLILPKNREQFARTLQPHINTAQMVGLPAILGLYRTEEVASNLQELIGAPLFEIPTIPPSVPGLRLKEALERGLRTKGVQYLSQTRVLEVRPQADDSFQIGIGRTTVEHVVRARGIILASGRFIGGGLYADRKRIKETIFDLPVYQPGNRIDWHRREFLDPRGHPVNRAGLKTDDSFRPLNSSGQPAFKTLFAAGSLLAHNDWKRLKCGAGVAIASAFGAVRSFLRHAK